MAHLLLLNPVKRKKSHSMRTRTRKKSRHIKRNPVSRKRRIRRNPVTIVKRAVSRFRARKHKSGSKTIVINPIGGHRRKRSSGNLGSYSNQLRKSINKDTLTLAGGAIASGFVSSFIINKFGSHLPGIRNNAVRVAYVTLIPAIAAIATRKVNKKLADGMVIGGVIAGLTEIIKIATGGESLMGDSDGMGEYLDAGEDFVGDGELGEYLDAGEFDEGEMGDMDEGELSDYDGIDDLGDYDATTDSFDSADTVFASSPAFNTNSW